MPPVKVKIEKIESQRVRQHTFQKRKTGLIKKAIELTILCDCDVSIIINKRHTSSNARSARLVAYSNRNIQDMIAECWDELEKCAQVTNAVYPMAPGKTSESNGAKASKGGECSDEEEGEGEDVDMQTKTVEDMAFVAAEVKQEGEATAADASRADINRKIALTINRGKLMTTDDSAMPLQQAQPAIAITDVNHKQIQQQQMQGRGMHVEMRQGGGGYFHQQQQHQQQMKHQQQHQQHRQQHQQQQQMQV